MKLLHERRIVGEVDGLVDVVRVRRDRRVRAVGEVRGAEVHLRLSGVEDHLPVIDAGRRLVTNRECRPLMRRLPDARVRRVVGVGAQIEQHADRDARLPAA